MILYMITYLLHGYLNELKDILYILENYEIWFIPMINVDGYSYVTNYFDKISETIILHKNRRPNNLDLCGK